MTNGANVFQAAIDELEKDYVEAERHANALLTSINILRAKAGIGPRPSGGVDNGSQRLAQSPSIKSDQFFGMKQQTAIKELLEMRKQQNLENPTTREIYDGLRGGGFAFEAKDDETAMIGLRATLRKRSETFVKMQNGRYGLLAWYPNLKRPRSQSNKEPNNNVHEEEAAAPTEDEAAA